MRLQVPAGWTRATALPAVPGLTLDGATGYTAPDGGAVMFGTVSEDADNSALLPTGLIQAAGGVPEQRTPSRSAPTTCRRTATATWRSRGSTSR